MTTKAQLLKTIRKNCIECMGGMVAEVSLCTSGNCAMFPYRMGKDPSPSKNIGFASPEGKKNRYSRESREVMDDKWVDEDLT